MEKYFSDSNLYKIEISEKLHNYIKDYLNEELTSFTHTISKDVNRSDLTNVVDAFIHKDHVCICRYDGLRFIIEGAANEDNEDYGVQISIEFLYNQPFTDDFQTPNDRIYKLLYYSICIQRGDTSPLNNDIGFIEDSGLIGNLKTDSDEEIFYNTKIALDSMKMFIIKHTPLVVEVLKKYPIALLSSNRNS